MTTSYSLSGDDLKVYQLNPLLQNIGDRLSKLEGYKGKPALQDYATDEGDADRYIINPDPPWQSDQIVAGTKFRFIAATTNTGASNITVSGNEYNIFKNVDDELSAGDIVANQLVEVTFDGTDFQYDPVPSTVTVANEGTDTTCFPVFVTAATGDLAPKTNASFTLNSNTAQLGVATINLTGGQITFPATQNASADANCLDDYEEGTWTPTLLDNTLSVSESQGYTTQTGDYVKIGKMVYVTTTLTMSSLGTLTTTQQARIGGLPFTPDISPSWGNVCHFGDNLNLAAADAVVALANSGSTDHLLLYKWSATTGTGTLPISEISADGQIRASVVYQATA